MGKKKALYIDLISPIGHKNYNYGMLRVLNEEFDIDLVIRRDFLDLDEHNIILSSIEYIPDKCIPELAIKDYNNLRIFGMIFRINQIKLINWIKSKYNFDDYDIIFFSSVDIISFSIGMLRFKGRCIFIDHGISDLSNNKIKKLFWKNLNKKLEIAVMEDYIKDYLIKELNIKNNIHILPHPLPSVKKFKYENYEEMNKKIIFAPGLENDENFIKYIYKYRSSIPKDYKIIMRSKEINYEDENILIYNNRISDKEYYSRFKDSSYILISYNNNYNYRTSGVLFEAIYFRKNIILRENNTLIYYKDKFPNFINSFREYNDFINILKTLNLKEDYISFDEVYNYYSDENIRKNISNIIQGENIE